MQLENFCVKYKLNQLFKHNFGSLNQLHHIRLQQCAKQNCYCCVELYTAGLVCVLTLLIFATHFYSSVHRVGLVSYIKAALYINSWGKTKWPLQSQTRSLLMQRMGSYKTQHGLSEYTAEADSSPRHRWTRSARRVRETETAVRMQLVVGSRVKAHLMWTPRTVQSEERSEPGQVTWERNHDGRQTGDKTFRTQIGPGTSLPICPTKPRSPRAPIKHSREKHQWSRAQSRYMMCSCWIHSPSSE